MVVKGDTLTVIRVIPDSETTDLYMEERRVDTGTWSQHVDPNARARMARDVE